ALPWLAGAKLDVALTGTRFGVRSKVLVGSTDLELGMNLQVRGTIGQPELWNRVEIQPGGKMTYDVVRREFEVVRGTLDFTGPMTEPLVDLTARTRVEYAGSAGDALVSSSRFSPDDSGGGLFDDQAVLVTLAVSGRYPDLDLDLSSNSKSLTQTDLQYLLLTGSTQAEGGSQMSSTFNLGLLTEDVTSLVTQALLGSFVDAISFGVSPSGGVNVDVMAHMGSRLKFDTRVLQGQGASRYSAGFHVRLTERLSLQGRVRGVEQSMDPDEIGQTYETKLRYRIPLE
ncbi:MAG TPA: translocation/assembly module TamB domain-containing protein, partial [Myxococcota bacterium]|nr:translocation/assembly module TamB domain-containing protein [Myxococcota bacterium]